MDQRLYPITPEFFAHTILPLIEGNYIWKGRPPVISHYQVFCAILYVLRTGCPHGLSARAVRGATPACAGAGSALVLWQVA
jgi:hypothetical protein